MFLRKSLSSNQKIRKFSKLKLYYAIFIEPVLKKIEYIAVKIPIIKIESPGSAIKFYQTEINSRLFRVLSINSRFYNRFYPTLITITFFLRVESNCVLHQLYNK